MCSWWRASRKSRSRQTRHGELRCHPGPLNAPQSCRRALAGIGSAAVPSIFPLPAPTASTVPGNGDVNPYGVAFVPRSVPTDGVLKQNAILVSNFNNNQNLQGTGTTIVQIQKDGTQTVFFTASGTQGRSAALGIFSDGLVLCGSLPSADGTSATARPGNILVIDRFGNLRGTLTNANLISGPWGMAIRELGQGRALVFVSNVLTGTILRMDVIENGSAECRQRDRHRQRIDASPGSRCVRTWPLRSALRYGARCPLLSRFRRQHDLFCVRSG
jgi:hypothetical protein